MHGNNGSGAMAALGGYGYVGAGTMQGAVNRPTPPVHNAQEMLDKAVASLLNGTSKGEADFRRSQVVS